MTSDYLRLRLLLATFAGWMNRQQAKALEIDATVALAARDFVR